MRVALCLSGLARCDEESFASIKQCILDTLDPDVFIHTWLIEEADAGAENRYLQEHLEELYRPKGIEFEHPIKFDPRSYLERKYPNNPTQNVLSMYYKIKKCNELKSCYERSQGFTYDVVIRARMDLVLTTPITPQSLKHHDTHLLIPLNSDFSGLNDQFALSSSATMDTYSQVYDHIEDYWRQGCLFCAELLLSHHVQSMKIPLLRSSIQYTLLRKNGYHRAMEPAAMWRYRIWVYPIRLNPGRQFRFTHYIFLFFMRGSIRHLDRICFVLECEQIDTEALETLMHEFCRSVNLHIDFRVLAVKQLADLYTASEIQAIKDDAARKSYVSYETLGFLAMAKWFFLSPLLLVATKTVTLIRRAKGFLVASGDPHKKPVGT